MRLYTFLDSGARLSQSFRNVLPLKKQNMITFTTGFDYYKRFREELI